MALRFHALGDDPRLERLAEPHDCLGDRGRGARRLQLRDERVVLSSWTGARYGYGWWTGKACGRLFYFAWGYGGRMVYVVPDLPLTVVMTSDETSQGVDGHVQALPSLFVDRITRLTFPAFLADAINLWISYRWITVRDKY